MTSYSANRHTIFHHRYHIVWITKYRYKVLTHPIKERVRALILQVAEELGVIPLMPKDISNTDGNKKQDCETNAAKRLIPKIRKTHPRMPMIWLADSLYATTPFIELVQQKAEDNFIVSLVVETSIFQMEKL